MRNLIAEYEAMTRAVRNEEDGLCENLSWRIVGRYLRYDEDRI